MFTLLEGSSFFGGGILSLNNYSSIPNISLLCLFHVSPHNLERAGGYENKALDQVTELLSTCNDIKALDMAAGEETP